MTAVKNGVNVTEKILEFQGYYTKGYTTSTSYNLPVPTARRPQTRYRIAVPLGPSHTVPYSTYIRPHGHRP